MEKFSAQNYDGSNSERDKFPQSAFLAYIAERVAGRFSPLLCLVAPKSVENRKTDTECKSRLFDALSLSLEVWAGPICNTKWTGSALEAQLV